MLQVSGVSLQFGSRKLFEDVNIKFTKGNCYGIIGANGAGKSTFLKILSGELDTQKGEVILDKNERMSVLKQDQNAYNDETVLRTVMLGHKRLVEVMDEKDALYAKADFTDEDGIKAGELETEFAELGGWDAESDAEKLLSALDIPTEHFGMKMGELDGKEKVKILLAQALFGNPDVLILDEPTNNLDIKTTEWLENFLIDFENTIIIVSHNRYFLNKVCTYICDVDFGKINVYFGNYDFWYKTSQLLARQQKEQNKKAEQRAKELKDFIARFSANASKSKQATARKKELESLTINDIKISSRKYPYINFKFDREIGNDILFVENLTKEGYFENRQKQQGDNHALRYFDGQRNGYERLFQMGQNHYTHLPSAKQRQLFRRLRPFACRLAFEIFLRPLRRIRPRLARQNAFLGRGIAEKSFGYFGRREGEMYACEDDARRRKLHDFRRADKPSRPRIDNVFKRRT